jgi:hypothetical protein
MDRQVVPFQQLPDGRYQLDLPAGDKRHYETEKEALAVKAGHEAFFDTTPNACALRHAQRLLGETGHYLHNSILRRMVHHKLMEVEKVRDRSRVVG